MMNQVPNRPWQEIAAEAARETNSDKLHQLTQELERALDERNKNMRPQQAEKANKKSA